MMLQVQFDHNQYTDDQISASIEALLDSSTEMAMATVQQGKSYINTTHYAYNDELELFIVSAADSEHSQNLAVNPSVAVAIWNEPEVWGANLRGLQLFGTAKRIEGYAQTAEVINLYSARFPDLTKIIQKPDDLLLHSGQLRFHSIRINRVKLLDEPRFGERNFISVSVHRQSSMSIVI